MQVIEFHCFRVPTIYSESYVRNENEQSRQGRNLTYYKDKTKTMSVEQTDSSLEIKYGLGNEKEIEIDDNISCQTDAITVIASNKSIATVSHF